MTRVLVIDDDDIARELLVSILQEGGYETFDLPSPIGASQMVISERIDVIVLDIMMPALSGDKLARVLRSNVRFRNLAIVFVSSCSLDELQQLAASVKANAVVSKANVRMGLLGAVAEARRSLIDMSSKRP